MIAQCLYQSDPKNLASMGRQRLACQRAARKLQWGVQKERISETNEPVPLLMRPAVKEILQDAEQHRFDVLLIGNRDSLCCDAADMESFLTVLNSFNIHIFAGGQGSWVEPNGRHYAPLPRLPWQEDDVAEVPQGEKNSSGFGIPPTPICCGSSLFLIWLGCCWPGSYFSGVPVMAVRCCLHGHRPNVSSHPTNALPPRRKKTRTPWRGSRFPAPILTRPCSSTETTTTICAVTRKVPRIITVASMLTIPAV